MGISGCREMCRLLNQNLDFMMDILLDTRRTKDDFNYFIINFKVAKFLSDTENVIDKMETAESATIIDFRINEDLEDLLRNNDIGTINHIASRHAAETETVVINDTNAVENNVGNNGDAEAGDRRQFPNDSYNIEANYLEPLLHYIQASTQTVDRLCHVVMA